MLLNAKSSSSEGLSSLRVPEIEEQDVISENFIRTEDVEIGLQFDFDVRTRSKLFGNLRGGFSPIVILDSCDQEDLHSLVGRRGCWFCSAQRWANNTQQQNHREQSKRPKWIEWKHCSMGAVTGEEIRGERQQTQRLEKQRSRFQPKHSAIRNLLVGDGSSTGGCSLPHH